MVVIHAGNLLQVALQAVLLLLEQDVAFGEHFDADLAVPFPNAGRHSPDVLNPLEQLLFVANAVLGFLTLFVQQLHQLLLVAALVQLLNLLDAHPQTAVVADIQQLHNLIERIHPVAVLRVDLRVHQALFFIESHRVDSQPQHPRNL